MKFFLILVLAWPAILQADDSAALCERGLAPLPRQIQPKETFEALVDWIYQDVIIRRNAPGLVVGVKGTDSILVFLAAARAFERAGRPERAAAIHFGDPNSPDWFQNEVLPWLREEVPHSTILVDNSIDPRRDGLRWGALLDWSVLEDVQTGHLRKPEDRFWVLGTRNATEDALGTFSNASTAVSLQPIIHLWKSEVLTLCRALNVPKIALQKSCEEDCICGRDQIAALNIPEIDALLMARQGKLDTRYVEATIPHDLHIELEVFIERKIQSSAFKKEIPYYGEPQIIRSHSPAPLEFASSRELARALPQLLRGTEPSMVAEYVVRSFNLEILPEALTLFNTQGLGLNQKQLMAQRIFNRPEISVVEAKRLADLSGRLGYYGFSFSQWRFLTKRYGSQPSLAEQFGMRRLVRNSDSQWGTGFLWKDGDWLIEYRQAYILISRVNGPTLVVRNNSHYFGRDRLSYPVYISTQPWSPDRLEKLQPGDLSSFRRFQEVREGELNDLAQLLDRLDEFNIRISEWMTDHRKLEELSSQPQMNAHIGRVQGAEPSWWPRSDADFPSGRRVLMSSPTGDQPAPKDDNQKSTSEAEM
jgi:NH3-dependent NAD+ synthetase